MVSENFYSIFNVWVYESKSTQYLADLDVRSMVSKIYAGDDSIFLYT